MRPKVQDETSLLFIHIIKHGILPIGAVYELKIQKNSRLRVYFEI